MTRGFPGSSAGKESACNAGDLGREDPLEEGMATHSSILAWRIPMDRGAWWATGHGVAESNTTERLSIPQHSIMSIKFLLNLSPPKISLRLA